jgi:hypothetical protein
MITNRGNNFRGVNKVIGQISVTSPAADGSAAGLPAAKTTGGTAFSGMLQRAVNSGSPKSLDTIFDEASQKYHVPKKLLKAVAKAESGFQADAVSSCGAEGVMQLMPSTAAALGVANPFDAEQNVMGGAQYLSGLLNKYGDQKLALAAYNAGSGNVAKYGGIPPFAETRNYVQKVLGYAGEDTALPEGSVPSFGVSGTDGDGSGSSDSVGNAVGSSTFTFDDYQAFLQIFLDSIEKNAAAYIADRTDQQSISVSAVQ